MNSPAGILPLSAVPLRLLHPPLVDRLDLDVGQDEPLQELRMLAQECGDLLLGRRHGGLLAVVAAARLTLVVLVQLI